MPVAVVATEATSPQTIKTATVPLLYIRKCGLLAAVCTWMRAVVPVTARLTVGPPGANAFWADAGHI
jgi:hypothetical protein